MIDCSRSFSLQKSRGLAPGLVSLTLCYMTVNTVVSVEPVGMLRIDCSGETTLHVPSSS